MISSKEIIFSKFHKRQHCVSKYRKGLLLEFPLRDSWFQQFRCNVTKLDVVQFLEHIKICEFDECS